KVKLQSSSWKLECLIELLLSPFVTLTKMLSTEPNVDFTRSLEIKSQHLGEK
ncbi:hypothetical protein STEG23_025605, partial [Scotinomys teguina]